MEYLALPRGVGRDGIAPPCQIQISADAFTVRACLAAWNLISDKFALPATSSTITVDALPAGLSERPVTWLDAAAHHTLFFDDNATVPVGSAGSRVGLWRNRAWLSAFPRAVDSRVRFPQGKTTWQTGFPAGLNGRPVVNIPHAAASGVLDGGLLLPAGSTAATIVALWVCTGNGHPINVGGSSSLGPDLGGGGGGWRENIGTATCITCTNQCT